MRKFQSYVSAQPTDHTSIKAFDQGCLGLGQDGLTALSILMWNIGGLMANK